MASAIDIACDEAVQIAMDDAHGYSQKHRDGPDYDCSSLVLHVLETAGYPVYAHGGSYTGNMLEALTACGFAAIRYHGLAYLQRGDVLLNEQRHTAICISPTQLVEATGSETGGIDGQTGDQTRHEIDVCPVYDPVGWSWEWVLRPPTSGTATDKNPAFWVELGTKGPQAVAVEAVLNYLGYGWVPIDGVITSVDAAAIRKYQAAHNLEIDGIVGPETYSALFDKSVR